MTATISVPPTRSRPSWRDARAHLSGPVAAPVIGVVAAVVSMLGAGNPSYWGDEAASVLAAQRPLPVLFEMLGHIDAVHGLYYVFLHIWIGVFGSGEWIVRFPSAIGVGLAAAGTVMLARALFTPAIGITAGLLFTVIPQVARMGAEARSYALGIAAAVWLTVWFVSLVKRRSVSRRSWALFAVASAASLYLFLYLGMLLLVHATWILLRRPGRQVVKAWGLSLLGALLLAAPIVVAGVAEREQIAFLARRDYATADSVFVGQWFATPAFAIVAWVLVVLAPIGYLRARAVSARRGVAAPSARERHGLIMVATWMLAPTALLIAGNMLITPMYNLRYVTFCTPAIAILMALGVRTLASLLTRRIDRTLAYAVVTAIVIAVAVPIIVEQRGPYAKDGGSDLRQTAEVIAKHASPGQAIVFDQSVKPSRQSRLALDLYPSAFAGLDDVALKTSYQVSPTLWDLVAPPSAVPRLVSGHRVVWVIEGSSATPDVDALEAVGYRVEQTIPVHRSTVYELVQD